MSRFYFVPKASKWICSSVFMLALASAPQMAWAAACTGGSGVLNASCTDLSVSDNDETIIINNGVTVSNSNNVAALDNARTNFQLTNNGAISGGAYGMINGGTITILSNTGTITSSSWDFINSGTIAIFMNSGAISSGLWGVINDSNGVITSMTNAGTISSGNFGFANDGAIGTLTNIGNISGGSYGLVNNGMIGTLNNRQGSSAALNFSGNLPSRYNVIINSSSSYGKLSGFGVSGTTTFGIYAGSTVASGTYSSVLSGIVPGNLHNTSGTFSGYSWGLGEEGSTGVWDLSFAPLTSLSDVHSSVQALSSNQRGLLIESRSTVNELLGMTRPMTTNNYAFAGGMFGSALSYIGEQFSTKGVTVLGGVAFGVQGAPNIKQDRAATIALATRYTFDDPFQDEQKALHPFVEFGGWVTPQEGLTLTRHYGIGLDVGTGTGATRSDSWGEYGRLGLLADMSADDTLSGYGELGQQYLSFNAYSEGATVLNPFPASVKGGLLQLDIVRAGGSWMHKFRDLELENQFKLPVSITLAGAAAHAFYEGAGLAVDVSGIGSSSAVHATDSWGEFGVRLDGQLTKDVGVDLDINGTTGGPALATALHGGLGLTYRF